MTHMIPQLELSDAEFERINAEAEAAGCTVYEYLLLKIGVTRPKPPLPKQQLIAPNLETKDAAELARKRSERAGGKAAE